MSNTYLKEGESLDFLNGTGSAIVADEPVVIGDYGIGISESAIGSAATDSGVVAVCGVYTLAKAAVAIAKGAPVYITVGAGVATAATSVAATGLYFAGRAEVAAASGDATVRCKLMPFSDEKNRVITEADSVTLTVADFKCARTTLLLSKNGTATVTLPAVASTTIGAILTLKKTGTAGAITLDGNSSETIEGATTHATCDAQNDTVTIQNTGAAWVVIADKIA